MFPTNVEHHYQQRNRRRGRNDPNNRDYICPCGKSYLSYPALFTHIKTKHNGRVFPNPYIGTRANYKAKTIKQQKRKTKGKRSL